MSSTFSVGLVWESTNMCSQGIRVKFSRVARTGFLMSEGVGCLQPFIERGASDAETPACLALTPAGFNKVQGAFA